MQYSSFRYEPDFSLGNYSQKFSETSAKYNAINKWEKSEIDFHQEFKKFASQIEESVESEIIPKLPRKGVLENALESLRDLYISQQRENNNENAVCKGSQMYLLLTYFLKLA